MWNDMDSAPLDGTLVDLNFDGIRHTDCYSKGFGWRKEHGYPSSTRVFLKKPTGWAARPDGLVDPYNTNANGDRYIP